MKPRIILLLAVLAWPTTSVAQCTDAQCNNRLTQRIAPRRLEENVNVNNNISLSLQLDTALTQVEILRQEVQQLRADIGNARGKDGKDGQPGANGTDGKDGQPGAAAAVDYDTIYKTAFAWFTKHKGEFVGPEGKPGAAAELPSFTVNFLDGEGKVARTEPVADGKINIPPQKAWWTRLDGKTEKQSRPLGDALKFQTELRQAKPQGAK